MASTYTDNNGIEKPGSGEQAGTWGTTTNLNFDIIDRMALEQSRCLETRTRCPPVMALCLMVTIRF